MGYWGQWHCVKRANSWAHDSSEDEDIIIEEEEDQQSQPLIQTKAWDARELRDNRKEMATHSSILVWRIPWTEEPAGSRPWDLKELDKTEHSTALNAVTYFSFGKK